MTRPRTLTSHDYWALPETDRATYDAEWSAYWLTPEGQTEIADRKAQRQARYVAALPAAIESLMRDPSHGLPVRALDIVLAGGLVETPALTAVRGAHDQCILSSGCGTGKTVSTVSWIHEHVAAPERWQDIGERDRDPCPRYRGRVPMWISAAQLARLDHYKQEAIDRVAKVERLVIDDLGSEFSDSKGFFMSLLDEIFDIRYAGKMPTVITTNLDVESFKSRYGARIADRLREAGRFVNCGTASLRRRPAP